MHASETLCYHSRLLDKTVQKEAKGIEKSQETAIFQHNIIYHRVSSGIFSRLFSISIESRHQISQVWTITELNLENILQTRSTQVLCYLT